MVNFCVYVKCFGISSTQDWKLNNVYIYLWSQVICVVITVSSIYIDVDTSTII